MTKKTKESQKQTPLTDEAHAALPHLAELMKAEGVPSGKAAASKAILEAIAIRKVQFLGLAGGAHPVPVYGVYLPLKAVSGVAGELNEKALNKLVAKSYGKG